MSVLYLTEQGSLIHQKYRRLIITKDGNVLKEISGLNLERILIFGNVQITTQAMAYLLDQGIETNFLSSYGKFRGRLTPIESKNVFLRIAQYERYLDKEFSVEHSRRIVEAKIRNARMLVVKYNFDHKEMIFDDVIDSLERALTSLKTKENVATILGVEGQASAAYFRAFGKMIRREFQFLTRSRRPPRDPVNALLSFGYTLITNEILSILCAIGFDPYIGYLHGINYGRPSLALDLTEEFRHPVIDRFTLSLVNNRVLSNADFEEGKDSGVYLKNDSRKKYLLAYEEMIRHNFKNSLSDEKVNFRSLFTNQAHKLANVIREGLLYQPFLWK